MSWEKTAWLPGLVALLTVMGFVWTTSSNVTASELERKQKDKEHTEKLDDHTEQMLLFSAILEELMQNSTESDNKLDSIYRRGLILEGKAHVMVDGNGGEYIQLNYEGTNIKSRYLDSKGNPLFNKVRITNTAHPEHPSEVFTVSQGTFAVFSKGYLCALSKEAGVKLRVKPEQWLDIKIEPIFDDE